MKLKWTGWITVIILALCVLEAISQAVWGWPHAQPWGLTLIIMGIGMGISYLAAGIVILFSIDKKLESILNELRELSTNLKNRN